MRRHVLQEQTALAAQLPHPFTEGSHPSIRHRGRGAAGHRGRRIRRDGERPPRSRAPEIARREAQPMRHHPAQDAALLEQARPAAAPPLPVTTRTTPWPRPARGAGSRAARRAPPPGACRAGRSPRRPRACRRRRAGQRLALEADERRGRGTRRAAACGGGDAAGRDCGRGDGTADAGGLAERAMRPAASSRLRLHRMALALQGHDAAGHMGPEPPLLGAESGGALLGRRSPGPRQPEAPRQPVPPWIAAPFRASGA